jgi:hypothetical protein
MANKIRLVYRCKTKEEAWRRVKRAETLVGKPFLRLPGHPDPKSVAFISKQNIAVKIEDVEIVYNDMLLMDAIRDHGKDGPLTKDTYGDDQQGRLMREVLDYAIKAYCGHTWQLKNLKPQ